MLTARPQGDHPGSEPDPLLRRGGPAAGALHRGGRIPRPRRGSRSAIWGPEDGAADVEALRGTDVIARIETGDIRVWDYADEFGTG
jgi:hypothetical protein